MLTGREPSTPFRPASARRARRARRAWRARRVAAALASSSCRWAAATAVVRLGCMA